VQIPVLVLLVHWIDPSSIEHSWLVNNYVTAVVNVTYFCIIVAMYFIIVLKSVHVID